MGEQFFDRAFNRVYNKCVAETSSVNEKVDKDSGDGELGADAQEQVLSPAELIFKAWREKDYFGLLKLPEPTINELGDVCWSCSSNDVSRAYRRLSLSVHPDKNPSPEARQAFDILNKVHALLVDQSELESILRDAADKAKARKEKLEARATVDEKITLNASKREMQKEQRRKQRDGFNDEIVRQMKQRTARMQRKRERSGRRSKIEDEGGLEKLNGKLDGGDGSNSDDVDEWQGAKRRKTPGKRKPKLIF